MVDLHEERLDASTAFTNVGVDYFGPFIVKIWPFHCENLGTKKRKAMVLSFHMPNYESAAYRSGTQVGH